jgi:tRNA(Ile2) C34 agmatinyltransferase TiaS
MVMKEIKTPYCPDCKMKVYFSQGHYKCRLCMTNWREDEVKWKKTEVMPKRRMEVMTNGQR